MPLHPQAALAIQRAGFSAAMIVNLMVAVVLLGAVWQIYLMSRARREVLVGARGSGRTG